MAFGVLLKSISMFSIATTADCADLSFNGTTQAYFERTSIQVNKNLNLLFSRDNVCHYI